MENTSDTKRKSGMELEVKDAVAEYRNRRKQEERIKAVENGRRV